MPDMTATAWVVHRIAGRLRLRVPEHKGDALYFATLTESVRSLPGVFGARPNPRVGSLLIEHDDVEEGRIEALLGGLGLDLADGEPPTEPPLQILTNGFAALERELRGVTGNAADLRTLGFVALATAGLVQVARGNAFAAASSLLWHAVELLREIPRQPAASVDPPPGPPSDRTR
jgi:hypothetical protein